jgi:cell division protein ZapE
MPYSSGPTLKDLYAREIRERGFREDPAQLVALNHLESLRKRLIVRREQDHSLHRRLLRKLGKRYSLSAERGLYLWGGVGRGKTSLMDLFYQSLPFEERRRRHFHRFMHDVHAELKTLSQEEAPLDIVAERMAEKIRVLCFDELFVSDIADAMILANLFAALIQRGVTLVFTSNQPPKELYKNGLQRQRFIPAIELIEQHTEVIGVDGGIDYRLRHLTQAGTYLPSEDPQTLHKLETLYREISDGSDQAGGTIEIEGRDIPVIHVSDTAVWFDFDALCEGPRSQRDYIEIAREYGSVIVSGVPVFDHTREDAARRFLALVDELYDRNVNLILSAATKPQDLYRGDRLVQQFPRAVSRLIEMQTEEYLARQHRC